MDGKSSSYLHVICIHFLVPLFLLGPQSPHRFRFILRADSGVMNLSRPQLSTTTGIHRGNIPPQELPSWELYPSKVIAYRLMSFSIVFLAFHRQKWCYFPGDELGPTVNSPRGYPIRWHDSTGLTGGLKLFQSIRCVGLREWDRWFWSRWPWNFHNGC